MQRFFEKKAFFYHWRLFPETKFYRASQVSFSSPGMRLNIDGEIISVPQAQVKILPGALLVHR